MRSWPVVAVSMVVTGVLLAGCSSMARREREGPVSLPRIEPPRPGPRMAVVTKPGALPKGARAHLPAEDGDAFIVAFPADPGFADGVDDMRRNVVDPVLEAVGWRPAAGSLEGPKTPVPHPRADAAALARAMSRTGVEQHRVQPRDIEKDVERQMVLYPFQQTVGGVPVEQTALVVTRRDGDAAIAVRGALIRHPSVENAVRLSPGKAVASAIAALAAVDGVKRVTSDAAHSGPTLVLLPYGTNAARQIRLRHAYRMTLSARAGGLAGPFLLWLDAERGLILRLEPLFGDATLKARVWLRDPSQPPVLVEIDVDDPVDGRYLLRRSGVMERLHHGDPGTSDAHDLAVPVADGPDLATPNSIHSDESQAKCASGTNLTFAQLHVAAAILRYHDVVKAQGAFDPFPRFVWWPKVSVSSCSASNGMDFGVCKGFKEPACADYSDGTTKKHNFLSYGQDATIVAHEIAHSLTPWLTSYRPDGWCGLAACAMPRGWYAFHDLADFWAAHLESTDCIGGWVAKNVTGVDAALYCRTYHDQTTGLPRRLDVQLPHDPDDPGDHFPEHRAKYGHDPYADGQIGGAALWEARAGMQSVAGPTGVALFGLRFQRALTLAGFDGLGIGPGDRGVYTALYDLLGQLVEQWATAAPGEAGPQTVNKVTAGFARTGLFLVPPVCLKHRARVRQLAGCPARESAADAVIDVDDADPENDVPVAGVPQRQSDRLRIGGPAPVFHVWTGPAFRLDGAGGSATTGAPLCNTEFAVEVSLAADFPNPVDIPVQGTQTITSGWLPASGTHPSTGKPRSCYGSWSPDSGQWAHLQAAGPGAQLYYRARTRGAQAPERLSTEPGGLWSVPAPYAVLTAGAAGAN